MEGMTKSEAGLAAMCDGPQMLHDYARVLAHEWPDACPHEVAIRLWNGLSQPARDAEILDSIACAYEAWGPFIEAKHGRLPRAADGCDGVKEFVRDIAEAEAQRKLALTVMLERDSEFLKAPTWGFTVQSWAIGAGIRSTVDELFAVDTSVKEGGASADSDDVTASKRPQVFEYEPYVGWIAEQLARSALFLLEDSSTLNVSFGSGEWASLQQNGSELMIQYTGDEAYPEYADWVIVPTDQREPLFAALEKSFQKIPYDREALADHVIGNGYRPTLWWMPAEAAYQTMIAFALKYDDFWEESEETQPADETADHVLALFKGSALLERVLDTLPAVEPQTKRMVEMLSEVLEGDAAEPRAIILSCLREYLKRYIQLEREEPAESFQEQDRLALARRVRHGFDSVARYAREVGRDSDISSQALADHLVGNCLDEEQRKQILGSDVDDCWELADRLTREIRDERGEESRLDGEEVRAS